MNLDTIQAADIPAALTTRNQWVLWKIITRDGKPTKVPFAIDGEPAKVNDPETWAPFEHALDVYERGGYSGLGFMFAADGGLVGIDLDGCRNPETGEVADWAKGIIRGLDTYAEISPSKTGVKLFALGPHLEGGNKKAVDVPKVCDKEPAIEVYDRGRYFAVTGWRLRGPAEPQERTTQLTMLKQTFWPAPVITHRSAPTGDAVVERARKYLAMVPGAVSGQAGHNATFKAACYLVCGFELGEADATALLLEWNQKCVPPWAEKDIARKIREAAKQGGPRGYLKNQPVHRFATTQVPDYRAPEPVKEHKVVTLYDATCQRIETARNGTRPLISLCGINELDYAIEGGVDMGEYVILGARPSHGKSLVALQGVHSWTEAGLPVLFISQEMSAAKLGERALQFLSPAPKEHWDRSADELTKQTRKHFCTRAPCYIVNDLRSAESAEDLVLEYIREKEVKVVVVDYAQILKGQGKDTNQQVSTTSAILRRLATNEGVLVVALCQLSRKVEGRKKFIPQMDDLKDCGQLEQDADVIIFQLWPHRLDHSIDFKKYVFFIAKNRNRAINAGAVECWFHPSRQTVTEENQYLGEANPNRNKAFDTFNTRKDL